MIERLTDLNLRCFGNRRFHDTHQQRLEEIEEGLVIRLLEDDVQIPDFDVDVFDEENTIAIFRKGGRKLHVEREALAAEEDVHDTGVLEGGKSLLLLDVVGDILQVALDLGRVDRETMLVSVVDPFAPEPPEGVGLNLEDVGHQVLGFDDKVFNDSINHRVADFNARNLTSAIIRFGKRTGTYRRFSKKPGTITSVTSERR